MTRIVLRTLGKLDLKTIAASEEREKGTRMFTRRSLKTPHALMWFLVKVLITDNDLEVADVFLLLTSLFLKTGR